VAYVEESLAAPDVLAEAGIAVGALVCGAPLVAAGAVCAIPGAPKLAASNIAAIDPGVAKLLFTLVPFRPFKSLPRNDRHGSLLHLTQTIATGWPNRDHGEIFLHLAHRICLKSHLSVDCGYLAGAGKQRKTCNFL
jgi:hypothetical protein